MYDIPKGDLYSNQNKKRIIGITCLVCFITVSLLSHIFLLTHANHKHDCNGTEGTCTICIQLQNAESLLRQLGTVIIGMAFILSTLLSASINKKSVPSNIFIFTPVALKIRMNH